MCNAYIIIIVLCYLRTDFRLIVVAVAEISFRFEVIHNINLILKDPSLGAISI